MLHDHRVQLCVTVDALWADKRGAEQGVVPVEDYGRLVLLGLLHRCQPDLLVGQTAQ